MRLFIWGTGAGTEDLLENELNIKEIEGFIDNVVKEEFMSKTVYSPQAMKNVNYDVIIVASMHSRDIYNQANNLQLDLSKFIFLHNNMLHNLNLDCGLISKIFDNSFLDIIKRRYRVIREMQLDETCLPCKMAEDSDMYDYDYVRMRTFELISREIFWGGIAGAVAELGVFRGRFAKYINGIFPDRTCYLFDTFEGFRESEALREQSLGNCGKALIERCKKTSEQEVLSLMPYPDRIVCKKGLFPESLDGLEDRFAFVSIDVDFEQSIYDGLNYFYPRLNTGGYIMVHDYNSKTLKGVRNAVYKYEKEKNVTLIKVPIPDIAGTLVISK